jgi:large subunit ribosomal protein L21
VRTGGKQYTVKPGDVLDVDKLPVDEGSSTELTDVLAVSKDGELIVGSPLVPEASVIAEVRDQHRDKKVIVFKYKRKVRYRRKKGHRQPYTRLAITAIVLDGQEIGVWYQPEPRRQAQVEPLVEEAEEPVEDEPVLAEEDLPTAELEEEAIAEEPADEVEEENPDEPEGIQSTEGPEDEPTEPDVEASGEEEEKVDGA